MRIAMIAPPWFPIPPSGYGGIEVVVSLLVDGLASTGHDVTLYASGGSRVNAEVVSPLLEAPDPALLGSPWIDAFHACAAYDDIVRRASSGTPFDVVHDHAGIAGPAIGAHARTDAPIVHTLHGPWHETNRRFYSQIADRVGLVAISLSQRDEHPNLPYAGVIHNGIDVDAYPLVTQKDDFCVYIGRATPDKGPTLAIEIARRAGLPLAMVVKRNEPLERAYWDEVVAPMLHDEVEVYENIDHARKVDLLGRACAMVFPIQWPEPFGLVMVEAMACGTPVVTCPSGAAVELVEEGVTGFLRSTLDELAQVVADARECSPIRCRERVVKHFSSETMVRRYADLYRDPLRTRSLTPRA
ncbi:MAG: glycosyltransferase family 4 protein [Acidimicrobiia bacterium]